MRPHQWVAQHGKAAMRFTGLHPFTQGFAGEIALCVWRIIVMAGQCPQPVADRRGWVCLNGHKQQPGRIRSDKPRHMWAAAGLKIGRARQIGPINLCQCGLHLGEVAYFFSHFMGILNDLCCGQRVDPICAAQKCRQAV